MQITINKKQITLTETKNVYQMNLTPIKGSKEFELLMSSKYAKKAYLVFPKSNEKITPANIQIWCDKIVRPTQEIPVVKITEFFPTDKMIAYQALVELPNNKRRAFYVDLRERGEEAMKDLIKEMLKQIRSIVPKYKLIKSLGTGNFLQAKKEFLAA